MIIKTVFSSMAAEKKTRVAIVGAGAAGLYASYLLHQKENVEIVHFEADSKIGGRVRAYQVRWWIFFDNLLMQPFSLRKNYIRLTVVVCLKSGSDICWSYDRVGCGGNSWSQIAALPVRLGHTRHPNVCQWERQTDRQNSTIDWLCCHLWPCVAQHKLVWLFSAANSSFDFHRFVSLFVLGSCLTFFIWHFFIQCGSLQADRRFLLPRRQSRGRERGRQG